MTARCYDKSFRYTRSEATDLHKTFQRIRRELAEADKAKPKAPVTEIKRRAR